MDRARRSDRGCCRGSSLGGSVPASNHLGFRGQISCPGRLGGADTSERHYAVAVSGFSGAATTFKRVVALDPHNKIAWYNLGVIAQRGGKKADARAAYDKALKIDPLFDSALFNEALLLKSSEPDRSIKLLKRVVAHNSKASTAYLHLGKALAKKGRDDEAQDAFGRAVAVDPKLLSLVPEPFQDSASPSPSTSQAGTTE